MITNTINQVDLVEPWLQEGGKKRKLRQALKNNPCNAELELDPSMLPIPHRLYNKENKGRFATSRPGVEIKTHLQATAIAVNVVRIYEHV